MTDNKVLNILEEQGYNDYTINSFMSEVNFYRCKTAEDVISAFENWFINLSQTA